LCSLVTVHIILSDGVLFSVVWCGVQSRTVGRIIAVFRAVVTVFISRCWSVVIARQFVNVCVDAVLCLSV